jgi:excisionase family DNA binding protein
MKPRLNSNPPSPPRLRDIPEACEVLRCSRTTIYRMIAAGQLRLVKARNKSLIAGLDEWLADQLTS